MSDTCDTLNWPDGARLALSLVVNVEEGAEANVSDGDPGPEAVDELGLALRGQQRNLGNESNYRYGINEGAERILNTLKKLGINATFTCAALALARSPDLARQIIGDQHEVCAHGYRWVHQFKMNEQDERNFINNAVEHIETATGQRPLGWLSRYLFTANTRRLLAEAGFVYHMDDYSRDQPFWDNTEAGPIVVLPYALDTNDMKLWSNPSYTPQDWLRYATDTFDVLYAEGASRLRMMSLGVHLRVIGRPGRIGYFKKFLDYALSKPGVWVTKRIDIAQHFADSYPFNADRHEVTD